MIEIDENLREQIAKEVLLQCKHHQDILISRIKAGNKYIQDNYNSLTEKRYTFLLNGLNELKNLAIWLKNYAKQIRVKYGYYDKLN